MKEIIGTRWPWVALACVMLSCESAEVESARIGRSKQAEGGCANPHVSCGDETNLIKTASTNVVLAPNVVMIPRSTWDEYIAEQGANLGTLQAEDALREQAVRVASIANDPMASGVYADELPEEEGGSFGSSDVLVVVDDPLVDPNSGRIYARNFFVAAVGLTGNSNWTRRGVRVAVEPTMMSGGGRCCGPENIGEQLEPTLGGPGTQPPGCTPGTNAYCAGWNTRLRPSGSINHDQRRTQAGRPIIQMRMFSSTGQTMRFSFTGPLGGLASGQIDCTQSVPMCLDSPGSGAFPWGGWEADLPHHSSTCRGCLEASSRVAKPRWALSHRTGRQTPGVR